MNTKSFEKSQQTQIKDYEIFKGRNKLIESYSGRFTNWWFHFALWLALSLGSWALTFQASIWKPIWAFGSHGEDTGLDSLLKEKKIDSIFCCGLAYDICVGETALSGAKLGYETYLIADASKECLAWTSARIVKARTDDLETETDDLQGNKDRVFDPQETIIGFKLIKGCYKRRDWKNEFSSGIRKYYNIANEKLGESWLIWKI